MDCDKYRSHFITREHDTVRWYNVGMQILDLCGQYFLYVTLHVCIAVADEDIAVCSIVEIKILVNSN